MHRSSLAALCPLLLGLAACLQDTKEIKVRPDGKGTLTVTTLLSDQTVAQIRQMAQALAQFGGAQGVPKFEDPWSEEKAKKDAAKYGKGVEFVSLEKVTKDGFQGVKVLYAFTDVSQLTLNQSPDSPMPTMPGQPKPGPDTDPLKFKFEKLANGNSLLTIVQPIKEAKEDQPASPPGTAQQMLQMKEMLKGFRYGITVTVENELLKTNSPHREGNKVTVMEVELDKVLEDPDKFAQLVENQPKTAEEMKKVMKDMPGVKFNPELTTTIEFK